MTDIAITPFELLHLLQQPVNSCRELVIDIRSTRQFFHHHIPGTDHLPAAALVSGEFPDSDLVLVADTEDSALQLRDLLYEAGFHRRIRHLQGGLESWAEAGFSLQTTKTADRAQRVARDSFPLVLIAALASIALAVQHAPLLLFSVTIGLILAPILFRYSHHVQTSPSVAVRLR